MGRRSDLPEEERVIERRRAKERELAKRRGQGGLVDASEMQARIRKLHDVHQISFDRISERTGVDLASVRHHYQGFSWATTDRPLTTCQWRVHNAIMMTPFGPADVRQQVRSTGTLRRLKALVAVGFPQRWLARETGRAIEHLNAFLVKDFVEVDRDHAAVVEQLYRKYADADPIALGVSQQSVSYARTVARKRRWPGPDCWDHDTIDDPDAVPEYTGACGTPEGYLIHIRETFFNHNPIPLCMPCRETVESLHLTRGESWTFRADRFTELLEERGTNPRALARKLFSEECDDAKALRNRADVFYRWRDGSRTPSTRALVQRVAGALDCDVSDLLVDTSEGAPATPAIGSGQFNPYVLRAALQISNLSYNGVAALPGMVASGAAVSKWARGEMKPSGRDKLQPIADHFGVDVEVFYQ